MISLGALVVLAAASARLVRLVQDDSIFDVPRDAALTFLHEFRFKRVSSVFFILLICHWCLGVWVSAAAVAAVVPFEDLPTFLVNVLAVAGGQALVSKAFEDDL